MSNISHFKADLREDHELFKFLMSEKAPKWWEEVKSHPELYVEIRKDNTINIYYYGASIARLSFFDNKLKSVTHPKYLGFGDEYKNDSNYYTKIEIQGTNPIKYEFLPKYQDSLSILERDLASLLESARINYFDKNNKEEKDPESISEKKIQGKIILQNKGQYIDSEFAHKYEDGKRDTIRIDLVKEENGCIIFEELKKIGDNRMFSNKGEPEILSQLGEYEDFLSLPYNQKALLQYYKILVNIKRNLRLPVPCNSEDLRKVDSKPQLLIYNNYIKDHYKRTRRIKNIQKILNENKVRYYIIGNENHNS